MYSDRSGHTKDVIPYKATVLCSLLPLANRSRPAAFDKVTSQPADIRIAAAWKLRLSKLIIRGVAPILPKSDCHLLFGMRGVVRETHLRIELKKGRHRKLGSWIDTYVRCIYLYTCIYIYMYLYVSVFISHTLHVSSISTHTMPWATLRVSGVVTNTMPYFNLFLLLFLLPQVWQGRVPSQLAFRLILVIEVWCSMVTSQPLLISPRTRCRVETLSPRKM